jgi:hypothetical protein
MPLLVYQDWQRSSTIQSRLGLTFLAVAAAAADPIRLLI